MTNKLRDPDEVGQEMLDDLLRIAKDRGLVLMRYTDGYSNMLQKPSRLQRVINFIGNRTWRKWA